MSVSIRLKGRNEIEVVNEEKVYADLLTALHEIRFGVPYFLVTVDYKTGDSFGSRSESKSIELFESGELAANLVKLIKEDADSYDAANRHYGRYDSVPKYSGEGKYSLDYTVDNGETRQTGKFWNGYFEHLEEVDIQVVWRVK